MQQIWRWVSPTTLLFALLIAPLPWVEVRCSSTNKAGETTTSVTTVSGLQAAIGANITDGKWEINPEKASSWMNLYFLSVVAGIGVGYRVRAGKARCVSLSVCILAAVVFLGLAILFHFGLADFVNQPPPSSPSANPGGNRFDIRHTPWLLLVYTLHMLTLVTIIGDWVWLRQACAPANLELPAVSNP
jgi:hypothetical protein